MDTHEYTKQGIRRFDIIVTKYTRPTQAIKLSASSPFLAKLFTLTALRQMKKLTAILYVIPEGQSEGVFVPQNFGDEEILRDKEYFGVNIPNIDNPLTLGADEYYVLGDNRDLQS